MKYYIETYGCQMNKYDSALIERKLAELEAERTERVQEAHIILINTCSVRAHAEKRALARIAWLTGIKRRRPFVKLVVFGCMAKNLAEKIQREFPLVDYVLGPDDFIVLPELIRNDIPRAVLTENVSFTGEGIYPVPNGISAYIAISRGCGNFCSYCIVPYARGPERHRKAEDIIAEVKHCLSYGVKEVVLLGQNVNSWRDGELELADLLWRISELDDLLRIRFITNHPKDLSDRLIITMRDNPKVCKSLHLPVQSGSTRILALMNRKYSRDDYIRLVEKIRENIPEITITTDIIVGFPTETDSDFMETYSLVEQVQFDGIFSFYFSPRNGTAAARMNDDIPYEVKLDRLKQIIELGNKIAKRKADSLIGKVEKVLVEKKAEKNPGFYKGLTDGGRVVILPASDEEIGKLIEVKIVSATAWALRGERL